MTEHKEKPQTKQDDKKKALDKRLDALGWGLFLIMIGCLWLIPEESVPEGTWLIGAGVIVLVLIGIRFLYGIKISGVWLVIGSCAGLRDKRFFRFQPACFPHFDHSFWIKHHLETAAQEKVESY